MNLLSLRVLTEETRRLVQFYEQVTSVSATWSTEDFAELQFPTFTLAIAHKRTMDLFGAGAAHAADNRSAIIEFLVADVDREYKQLKEVIHDIVQPPTTQPWGNRSFLFRDPDGNLINFFTPVTESAIKKFHSYLPR